MYFYLNASKFTCYVIHSISKYKLILLNVIGKPLPTVTWWRDRTQLIDQSSDTDKEKGVVRNELSLESLKREDLLTQYVCQASNTNLTQPATASVQLDISRKL